VNGISIVHVVGPILEENMIKLNTGASVLCAMPAF